jgi:hypothetical protein
MFILNLKGRPVKININKSRIKWDKKVGSNAQFKTKQFFKSFWIQDLVCEEFVIPQSRLRIDLINFTKKIIVETSGQQHENFVEFFHGNRVGFLKSIKRDYSKIKWSEINDFLFLEIYDTETDLLSEDFIQKKFNLKL